MYTDETYIEKRNMPSNVYTFRVFMLVLTICIYMSFFSVYVSADRTVIDLSGYDWGVFRDFNADWIDDDIYLPPVNIAELPVSPPTCGWTALKDNIEKTVCLPATVEEYFWGDNDNDEGVGGEVGSKQAQTDDPSRETSTGFHEAVGVPTAAGEPETDTNDRGNVGDEDDKIECLHDRVAMGMNLSRRQGAFDLFRPR